jgi:hypothetical protein
MLMLRLTIASQTKLADPPSSKIALSGSVIISHSYDDIPLFVSQFKNGIFLLNNVLRARLDSQ